MQDSSSTACCSFPILVKLSIRSYKQGYDQDILVVVMQPTHCDCWSSQPNYHTPDPSAQAPSLSLTIEAGIITNITPRVPVILYRKTRVLLRPPLNPEPKPCATSLRLRQRPCQGAQQRSRPCWGAPYYEYSMPQNLPSNY